MYLDANGLIVTQSSDGGDTLQREGFWYEGTYFGSGSLWLIPNLSSYSSALGFLDYREGFVRNPKAPYNVPGDTSRDQLVSNIRACGYYGYFTYLDKILLGVINNFSRFPNGDLAFINDYGRFIRAYKWWALYPLLLIFDIPLVVNALLICFWLSKTPRSWQVWLASKVSWLYWLTNQYPPNAEGVAQSPYGPTNTSNDINFIGDLQQAKTIYPTPISFLARKIYEGQRPYGIQFALDNYFSASSGNNVEFANLWAPIVQEF